ncbi:MAG: hypothetical protein NTX53_10220 [candidate division WOR-3 bacterium]|nr:hypothetical protein [candidate division WOR-3 bacterium]
MEYTREFWLALMLAAATPAVAGAAMAGPGRPGSVVVDVRARGAGSLVAMGSVFSLGVEPDALFLWPNGQGIGVDLGLDLVVGSSSGGQGGGVVAGLGLKYAVMRRIGNGPLFSKYGAGASLLLDQGFNAGARVRLEGGFTPVAARRVAFPVQGVLTVEVYGGGGAWVSLGLSLGAGWVFAGR